MATPSRNGPDARRALLLLLVLAACGGTEVANQGPSSFIAQYRLVTDNTLTVDSVKYDNGTGTLIKVTAPAAGWSIAFSVPHGSTLAATAWFFASGPGTANIKVTWTGGGVGAGDSSVTSVNAAGHFSVDFPTHTI